jgi:hypothetical protein
MGVRPMVGLIVWDLPVRMWIPSVLLSEKVYPISLCFVGEEVQGALMC